MASTGLIDRALAPLFLTACILLGGATAGGAMANFFLQLLAIVLLLVLAWRHGTAIAPRPARPLLILAACAAAWLCFTLIPLPASLWHGLPGREEVAAGFGMIGSPLSALPTSLAPDDTIAALLALLPPLAMYLCLVAAPVQSRRDPVVVLIALTLASIVLGVMQQVSGYRSNLYIYDIVSRGGATGFFANRNHLATLCLMALPFVAALAAAPRAGAEPQRGAAPVWLASLLFLVVGALLTQSLAGWLLLVPSLMGSLLVYRWRRREAPPRALLPLTLAAAAVAVAMALVVPFPNAADRLGEARSGDRQESMRLTWDAAQDYLPLGSGFGSFTQVYPQYEPAARVSNTFVNHAHNDYLELLLEGGLPALALVAGFLFWWVRRARWVWTRANDADPLARAGSVAVAVLLAHSFVDYPARTAAIAAVVALACALMTTPAEAEAEAHQVEPERRPPARDDRTIRLAPGSGAIPRPA